MSNTYETEKLLAEYLLFHYGESDDLLPWPDGPRDALEFPQRCAQLVIDHTNTFGSALDLGCAVGRSTFSLAERFEHALGIDYSQAFVNAANDLRDEGQRTISIIQEADQTREVDIVAPPGKPAFEHGDACALREDLGSYDALLMANLICRLHTPAACLDRLPGLVNPGGVLVITTPNTWLEEFTPREKWIPQGAQSTLEGLQGALTPSFELLETANLPFLIREHARKFQWTVAEASVWRRN